MLTESTTEDLLKKIRHSHIKRDETLEDVDDQITNIKEKTFII